MTFHSKDDEPAEEFDEILLEFLRKHDSGQPIDREAFLRQYPEHREKLATLLVVPLSTLLSDVTPIIDDDARKISVWLRDLQPADREFILELVKRQAEHLARR